MTLKDILRVMSGGTTVQLFCDCKELFFGKLNDALTTDIEPYFGREVYRVNIDTGMGAITIAF